MLALVTGGAGFVGSALVDRLLAEGHRVEVIDDLSSGSLANLVDARRSGRLGFTQLDVRSPEVVQAIAHRSPEVIWHLAAQRSAAASIESPALDAQVNIVGTLNVLAGARAAGSRKVIVTSSASAVYGEAGASELPLRENHARRPRTPHGVAKHAVDSYLAVLRELRQVEFTSLVLGSVYGPPTGEWGHGVVAQWARLMLSGDPCTVFGDGGQSRDFVFIDDVVDALARSADRGDGLMLNVGSGVETSLRTLYAGLASVFREASAPAPASEPVSAPARPGDVHRCQLDVTRAALHLDWRPWTGLADGLRAVVEGALRMPRSGVEAETPG